MVSISAFQAECKSSNLLWPSRAIVASDSDAGNPANRKPVYARVPEQVYGTDLESVALRRLEVRFLSRVPNTGL